MDHGNVESSTTLVYQLNRPVLCEEYISTQLLHKKESSHKTVSQKVAKHICCSSEKVRSLIFGLLPILTWLPSYPVKKYLFGDIVSGLSTGVMQLPQGLAYAMLAAVPPVYGLYSSFYPVLLYTFFGTSRHISIGTFAVISLMIGSVTVREVPDSMLFLNGTDEYIRTRDEKRVQVAVALTALVGLFQGFLSGVYIFSSVFVWVNEEFSGFLQNSKKHLVLGLLHFGFVAIYLTEPLVRGFTTAAAVHVFVSQIKYLIGVETQRFGGPLSVVYSVIEVCKQIPSTKVAALVVGLVCIVFLYGVKVINERFKKRLPIPIPGEIIVVIVSTGVSYGMDLFGKYQVNVVGVIPTGLRPPSIPDFNIIRNLVVDAVAIAVVGFSIGISLAKIFSLKYGYSVNGNQELIALGLCNFVSSFFHTFAVTCSMSRSLVQESTGGKTQIAGLLASLLVLLVILAIGFVFQHLPQTVLAAIIMVNLLGMFKQLRDVPALWRTSRLELAIWVVAFVASVLLGLDYGLLVAITFAILTVIYRTQSPKTVILGQIPNTGLYCDTDEYEEASECSGIKIFCCNSSIYFANSDQYVSNLKKKTGIDPSKLLAERKALQKRAKRNEDKKCHDHRSPKKEAEFGVSHEMAEETQRHEEEQGNGQVLEVRCDSDETNSLQPLCHVHSIILDFSPVNFMDSVGAKAIKSVIKEYAAVNVNIVIAGCSRILLSELSTLQFFSGSVTREIIFPTIHDAVQHCQHTRTHLPLSSAVQ